MKENLTADVGNIFAGGWETASGRTVPVPENVGLAKKAVFLEQAVVLYADLDGSTSMVDTKRWEFSAEIYKAFLHCAAKLIKDESGDITAYDGDRVMAIFIGDNKCDRAVRAAMKLKWTVANIIQPGIARKYTTDFVLAHTVGIDMSDLRAVRTGVRGDNDLVWVGRAANYAAKLTTLSRDFPTRITKNVYDRLSQNVRFTDSNPMWEAKTWTAMGGLPIYRSAWGWIVP